MALTYTVETQDKIVRMADDITVLAPLCREANKTFDGVERGDGYSVLVDPPDVGVVGTGAKITDDTNLSVNRPNQITITLSQKNTGVQFVVTDNQVDFKDNETILGLRAQNLGATLHSEPCTYLSYGLTAHVATAGKELTALATATAKIRAHRGYDIIGAFSAQAMPALFEQSSKSFLPDEISKATYKESSIGRFGMANWFETQDISVYNWTNTLTGTVGNASITFVNGEANSVVVAGTTLAGTVIDGTPFKLSGLKSVDVLQRATGEDVVLYVDGDIAPSSATSITLPLKTKLFISGNRKNVALTGNLTGATLTWLLTSGKQYAKSIVYAKATNMYRQAELQTVMGAQTSTIGDGVKDLKLKMSADGDLKAYSNIMRIDALTGGAMGYAQWAHTVFFPLN